MSGTVTNKSNVRSTRAICGPAICAAAARWIVLLSLVGTTIAAPTQSASQRWSSPLSGQTAPGAQPGGAVANPATTTLRSDLSPGILSLWLPLFCCLVLLASLVCSIRKLHNANSQLERRTHDLSSSNEQLKREIGERRRIEQVLRASDNLHSSLVE